jgi:tRNA(fMet)-specific endonuclease VapC
VGSSIEYLQRYSKHAAIRKERKNAEESVDGVLPVDAAVAEEAANIRARLASSGTTLDVPDLLIAAVAREHGCTLVTRNKNDFDKTPIHELMEIDIIQ